jgi:para-aminobenzoate synthetase component 1
MAGRLERLPHARAAPLDLPALRLSLYDRGIVLDHAARRAYAVRARLHSALGVDVDPDWRTRWEQAACACVAPVAPPQNIEEQQPERAAYEGAVQRALKYIAAGDIYQVNLARCVRLSITADALALYERVRAANPAPYAALLRWQGGAVASVSPELFLRVCGREVLTSPIKGTRPRTGHPAPDAARREELWHSAKERAELAMIVDLHRNDLGRVCEPGSVVVRCARRLEAHPTVMHTVADVAGRLAPERDGLDLLRACFPAGSISGVPKIRALQIIHALEPVGRGAYTGAIGVLSLSGDMFWNVAIRTLQIQPPAATLYVGGGIVADSDPAAEYLETCAKAAGILGGIRGTAPSAARAW